MQPDQNLLKSRLPTADPIPHTPAHTTALLCCHICYLRKIGYSTSTVTLHNISVGYYWVKRLPMNNTFFYTRTYIMQNTHHQQVVKAAGNVNICIGLQIKCKGINCSIFCMTILHVYTWNNIQSMYFNMYNLRKLKCECFQKTQGSNKVR